MINAVLKVIGGKQDGKLIPLTTKKFLIGREQDCHLRPNSDSVSRHHCVITLDDFVVQVRDLGSSNGTFLNGVRVLGVQQAKSGDRLKIGTLEFDIVCNLRAAVGAGTPTAPTSSGTAFSLDDFGGLEDVPPSQETAVVSATTEDTVIVNPATPTMEPSVEPTASDELNLDDTPTEALPPDALSPEQAIPAFDQSAMPIYDAAAMGMGMPQGMPGMPNPAMPGMGYPSPYGQPPGYPGYGMQMPQPGYPYGAPQQPYPGYGMPMQQPGYGMQPMYGGLPGAMPQMPYGQPGYAQPMNYAAYPQGVPQAVPQVASQPEATPAEAPKSKKMGDELPVKLPPPEETGAKVPVADPNKPKEAPKAPAPNPAAEVLKKYMNRR